jgi:hypothetical protein
MLTPEQAAKGIIDRGADRAVVLFSGGCDEGGVDSITLYRGDEPLGQLRGLGAADEALADALSQDVYDRWYGFEGDFSVSGSVTWDLAGNAITFEDSHNEPETRRIFHED